MISRLPLSRPQRWLVVILLAAALLRFGFLGSKSLWFDEAFSVSYATTPLDELWSPNLPWPESHPPLYYVALHFWIPLFGTSETAVRLPSALISLLNVGLLYLLVRRLLGRRVALIAAALLALSPLAVWYAQEARMYVFVTCSGLLAALLLTGNHWLMALPLTAVLALGFYFDYTMLPLWVALSAVWLVWWRYRRASWTLLLAWLGATLGGALLALPWRDEFFEVLESFNGVYFFLRLHDVTGFPFLTPVQYLLLLGVLGIVLLGATAVAWRWLQRPTVRRVAVIAALTAFLLATAIFPLPRFFAVKRLLVVGWPFVVLFVAWGLTQLGRRQRPLLAGALAVSLVASLVTLLAVPKDDWRGVVAYVNDNLAPEEVVWLTPAWNIIPYKYYEPVIAAQLEVEGRPSLEETVADDLWLVAERFPGQPTPSSTAERWLDAHWTLVETVPFYRLELRHYRPATQ